jgi:hypothetical protein
VYSGIYSFVSEGEESTTGSGSFKLYPNADVRGYVSSGVSSSPSTTRELIDLLPEYGNPTARA